MSLSDGRSDYGGTASPNDCGDTPNDLCARVTQLEFIVEQLLGVNIGALELSDFSQDLGTIVGGDLNSGLLDAVLHNLAKISPWAKSGTDVFINSSQVLPDVGAYEAVTTNTTVNAGIGRQSSLQYMLGYRSARNPYGDGVHFSGRFGIFCPGHPSTLDGIRCIIGLTSATLGQTTQNSDDPPGHYVAFQFSAPRGDATWKFFTRGEPDPGVFMGNVYETGVPALPIQITAIDTLPRNWYDFYIRSDYGTNVIRFGIKNLLIGNAVEMTVPVPSFWHDISDPPLSPPQFSAGFGVWNNESGQSKQMWIQNGFARRLLSTTSATTWA